MFTIPMSTENVHVLFEMMYVCRTYHVIFKIVNLSKKNIPKNTRKNIKRSDLFTLIERIILLLLFILEDTNAYEYFRFKLKTILHRHNDFLSKRKKLINVCIVVCTRIEEYTKTITTTRMLTNTTKMQIVHKEINIMTQTRCNGIFMVLESINKPST